MRFTRTTVAAIVGMLTAGVLVAAAMAASPQTSANRTDQMSSMHGMAGHTMSPTKTATTAADLRVSLDNLFGEHAVLAMNATNAGVTGIEGVPRGRQDRSTPTRSLSPRRSRRSTAPKPVQTFLNGKFMWRDHIKFFVDYTVAKRKNNMAGQDRAVANLKQYTVTFGDFLAGATGLPKLAVRNDLLGHVLELKNQLDAYASGDYTKAAADYHAAYNHMLDDRRSRRRCDRQAEGPQVAPPSRARCLGVMLQESRQRATQPSTHGFSAGRAHGPNASFARSPRCARRGRGSSRCGCPTAGPSGR